MGKQVADMLRKAERETEVNLELLAMLAAFDAKTTGLDAEQRRRLLAYIIENVCGYCCAAFRPCYCACDE